MKRIPLILMVGVILLTACQPAKEGLEVRDYWLRMSALGGNSAMYMVLQNHEDTGDELIGASSEVAESVEVHGTTVDADGVMHMAPVPSVELTPGEKVSFEPGGLHVMFIGLKQDLIAGNEVEVTLHFKNHEDIVLTVPVQAGGGGMIP